MFVVLHDSEARDGKIWHQGEPLTSDILIAVIEQELLQVNRVSSYNRGQTAGPADVFKTKDGYIMCLVIGAYQFERWAAMIGRPGRRRLQQLRGQGEIDRDVEQHRGRSAAVRAVPIVLIHSAARSDHHGADATPTPGSSASLVW